MKLITHHFSLLTLLLTSHFSLLTCYSAVPLRWTVETSRLQPAVFDVVRGETLELEATFKSYGMPVETSNMTAFVCWQTNGMGSAWWVTNAVTTATVVRALFTPAMDPGTPTVTAFMGLSSATNSSLLTSHSSLNYRAAFTLRYRHGPGATPNAIDTPPRVLDLANTVVVNPPWPTQADFAATTTVMRAELKDYVDDQIEGAGLVTPTMTTNIAGRVASNVVTKAYVEGLGIESGLDTNAVRVIVAEATNAIPRIVSGGYEIKADGEMNIITDWTPSCSTIADDPQDGDHYWENPRYFDISGGYGEYGWFCDKYTFDIYTGWALDWQTPLEYIGYDPDATSLTFPDGTTTRRLLRTRLATTNDVSTSSAQTLSSAKTYADATTNGLATASTVSSLASQVSAIGAHLNAEDAHFVSTNYDSAVRLPEAYVEIKMNGTWITIWREMTRWTRFVGDAFTWDGWGGLHTWMTNVTAELSYKADRCWGIYDSETGGLSPEGCTQISSSNILVAANMAFQKTVTSGGAVWVLQCNSGVAHVGGDTNGFFRISDLEGATQFEIVRGDKQELGADADGITVDNSTSPPTVTIPYSVEADEHPTLQVCDDLISAQWKAETDAGCVANVTWTGSSGAYVATVQRKTAGDKLFVKATYMSGGETYIRNVAPVGMDAIILNGTKFYLGTNVISGKLVLTLSTTPQNQ